jgi:hypothetical protein
MERLVQVMDNIGIRALLDLWDRGHALSRESWALALLDAAHARRDGAQPLAQWPVGRRDLALLKLRGELFGRTLNGLAPCPLCREHAEFVASVDELAAAGDDSEDADASSDEYRTLHAYGCNVCFRAVTTEDLQAIETCGDPERAAHMLMARCVLAAHRDDAALSADALPRELVDALAARMEATDPHADIELGVCCPTCGHKWHVTFDIVSFLWKEIGAWAMRVLREVHELASAYGWSEAQILSISPARRQFYLGMLGT